MTVEAALSAQGMFGHAACLLLVVTTLMRVMFWLRLFVLASSIIGVACFGNVLSDPVSVFREVLLVVVEPDPAFATRQKVPDDGTEPGADGLNDACAEQRPKAAAHRHAGGMPLA